MYNKGAVLGLIVAAAFAGLSIYFFQQAIWGNDAPLWFIGPSILWGFTCGLLGLWLGDRYV